MIMCGQSLYRCILFQGHGWYRLLHLCIGYSTPTQHINSGTDSSTFILDIELLHNISVQVQTHPPTNQTFNSYTTQQFRYRYWLCTFILDILLLHNIAVQVQTPPPLYWIFNSYITQQFRYRLIHLYTGYYSKLLHNMAVQIQTPPPLYWILNSYLTQQLRYRLLHLYTGYSTPTQQSS